MIMNCMNKALHAFNHILLRKYSTHIFEMYKFKTFTAYHSKVAIYFIDGLLFVKCECFILNFQMWEFIRRCRMSISFSSCSPISPISRKVTLFNIFLLVEICSSACARSGSRKLIIQRISVCHIKEAICIVDGFL